MSKSQVRRIKEWRPCFAKSSNVMIQGYLEGDPSKKLWRSSIIEYRESPRTLVTKGGGKYRLVGSINKKACVEKGFPSHVIEQFIDGFPDEWREILVTQYNNLSRTAATTRTDIDHDFDNDNTAPPKPKKKKKEIKAVVPYKTTPTTVARTQSGRIVKPRTATWANQSIVYDNSGKVIEIRNPITTTRQSKKVNQNLGKLCNSLGVETPEVSQVSEKSINTPPRKVKVEVKKKKEKKKNNLVQYSESDDDSIDEVSLDGIELLETGNTPIRPSNRTTKKLQQRIHVLDSSSEDEQDENEKPSTTKVTKKKRTVTTASTKNVKHEKKNEQVRKGISLKKSRQRTPDLVDFDDPVVEFPESDKENEIVQKKWSAKEKDRFLQLLKITNPVNDNDWEDFRINNKTDRTIEEMKEKAKELKWKPSRVRPTEEATVNQIHQITAKPGTVAHIMQANQVNQNYLSAKNKNAAADEHVRQVRDENYVPLHINDSVMSMLRTPQNARRQRAAFNPTFDINLDGSSLNESSMLSESSPSFMIPQNEESRRKEQAYGLKVLKKTQTRTRQRTNGQNSTVFTDTITTTMNFMIPPQQHIPRNKPFAHIEEEYNSEEEEEEEEEEENDMDVLDDY